VEEQAEETVPQPPLATVGQSGEVGVEGLDDPFPSDHDTSSLPLT
jgi:hypothetical protein